MNLNLITISIKSILFIILNNLTPILFLIGLGTIVTAVLLINLIAGLVALGLALILIALILAKENNVIES